MKTLEELGLSEEEINFVQLVYMNQGCKLYQCIHQIDENNSVNLYEKPEQLGLITCVGSYKWRTTDKIEMMLVARL